MKSEAAQDAVLPSQADKADELRAAEPVPPQEREGWGAWTGRHLGRARVAVGDAAGRVRDAAASATETGLRRMEHGLLPWQDGGN